jgi:hypothetical protein
MIIVHYGPNDREWFILCVTPNLSQLVDDPYQQFHCGKVVHCYFVSMCAFTIFNEFYFNKTMIPFVDLKFITISSIVIR